MPPQPSSPEPSQSTLMLAYLCIKDLPTLNERVDVLDRFALSDEQIAKVCQAAIGSVRNARLQNKKAASAAKRKSTSKAR